MRKTKQKGENIMKEKETKKETDNSGKLLITEKCFDGLLKLALQGLYIATLYDDGSINDIEKWNITRNTMYVRDCFSAFKKLDEIVQV